MHENWNPAIPVVRVLDLDDKNGSAWGRIGARIGDLSDIEDKVGKRVLLYLRSDNVVLRGRE